MAEGGAVEEVCAKLEEECEVTTTAYRWSIEEVEAEELTKKVLAEYILESCSDELKEVSCSSPAPNIDASPGAAEA